MVEIGSEFQLNSAKSGANEYETLGLNGWECHYMLSGRTALACVADELLALRKIKKIALPAYSCASMVYPFLNKGIEVVFYSAPDCLDQVTEEYLAEVEAVVDSIDAVLIMDYFGFVRDIAWKIAAMAKEKNKSVIVDATQSAFSNPPSYSFADYVILSCRKWRDSLCGLVLAKQGFLTKLNPKQNSQYITVWQKAAFMKNDYLNGAMTEKKDFLDLYSTANNLLGNDYEDYFADNEEVEKWKNIDSKDLIKKRRENAEYLIKMIKAAKINGIFLPFENLTESDCPLFVPICVEPQKRGEIRQFMAKRDIYCPMHWPIDTKYCFKETKYHSNEISLICDQRYNLEDMEREVSVLTDSLKL